MSLMTIELEQHGYKTYVDDIIILGNVRGVTNLSISINILRWSDSIQGWLRSSTFGLMKMRTVVRLALPVLLTLILQKGFTK